MTPLHEAAFEEKLEVIKLLLAAGADKEIVANSGKKAIDYGKDRSTHKDLEALLS